MEHLYRFAIRTRRLPLPLRYAAATGFVLVALGLRWWVLGPGPGYAFLFFYPAVILSGAVLDRGTGMFTTALSAALGIYFFIAPAEHFAIGSERDLAAVLIFLATSGFIALLLEAGHHTFGRMTEAQNALTQANAELTTANDQLLRSKQHVEALLHENIHRFRNDLQRLSATVGLQTMMSRDPGVQAALTEVQGRINALNSIKARLDLALRPEKSSTYVEAQTFLSGLVEDWSNVVGIQPLAFRTNIEAHELPATKAVLLGLILNELMTNAVKYAFPNDRAGTIWVVFHRQGDDYVLRVEDDGVGINPAEAPQGTGLGGRIVRSLASQLGGQLDISPRAGGGTACSLTAPVASPA
jgi:two-component sensor histidine kinase